ncbi:MAG: mechanosensitive ion channel [Myxococcales bacterium]|nr:mechanosensitive ion channel [Myxococcales bacterium]MCB9543698.1 mechanosensitive ion channel [Myxococcales bacterium]MCB9551371.1 mechanosensitive ion channel [Myxococcales bacterium]
MTEWFEWLASRELGWLWRILIALGAVLVALIIHGIAFAVLLRTVGRTRWIGSPKPIQNARGPARVVLIIAFLRAVLPFVIPPGATEDGLAQLLVVLLVLTITWLLVRAISGLDDAVMAHYDITAADNLHARRVHTQARIVSRIVAVLVGVVGVAVALMTFPRVRELGAGLLASAGVAGLVIGLALRPTLESLLAGLQLAVTEPIRLDDVVIVEGEWGRVEEITATYVVIRIWDERRLVVPLSRFLQQPFQNWTRKSAQILGTVFLYLDYGMPVDRLRAEVDRLVKAHALWDGRVCVTQVTDAKEKTMEIRVLISAADSGKAWDLRVWLREQLIAWLQREHPEHLPRARIMLREGAEAEEAPATHRDPTPIHAVETSSPPGAP